jgi:hypothetical protein
MSAIKDARHALNFLQKSGLVNLETPISKVVAQAGELEIAGRGSVLIWSQWVLITSPCSAIVAIGERPAAALTAGPRRNDTFDIGEAPRKYGPAADAEP